MDLDLFKEKLGIQDEIQEIYAMDGTIECIHAKLNRDCEKIRFVLEKSDDE